MLAVVSAGCVQDQTQQPTVGTQIKDGVDFSKLTVDLKTDIIKEGVTYNVGDTMEVRLQSYPYLGLNGQSKNVKMASQSLREVHLLLMYTTSPKGCFKVSP